MDFDICVVEGVHYDMESYQVFACVALVQPGSSTMHCFCENLFFDLIWSQGHWRPGRNNFREVYFVMTLYYKENNEITGAYRVLQENCMSSSGEFYLYLFKVNFDVIGIIVKRKT